MKIGVFGNCQTYSYAECLRGRLPDCKVTPFIADQEPHGIEECDLIFQQNDYWNAGYLSEIRERRRVPFIKIPTFYFPGFHPDLVIERDLHGAVLHGPAGSYNSSIVIYGYLRGLTVSQTIALFDERVYDRLGFFEYWSTSKDRFKAILDECTLDGSDLWNKIESLGIFAYSVNHFIADVARLIIDATLEEMKLGGKPHKVIEADPLKMHGKWPVYPAIARSIGVAGDYKFCFGPLDSHGERAAINLDDFVGQSYSIFDTLAPGRVRSLRIEESQNYNKLEDVVRPKRAAARHVYADLPKESYWKKAISMVRLEDVDPVCCPRFTFGSSEKISTAGSCFAQHIARTLISANYNYYVTERAPDGLSVDEAHARGYGQFSARYGNIYTARQLKQLIDRSCGEFFPKDSAWQRPDGKFIDPFRPQIEPRGFDTVEQVERDRQHHLRRTYELFRTTDVFCLHSWTHRMLDINVGRSCISSCAWRYWWRI